MPLQDFLRCLQRFAADQDFASAITVSGATVRGFARDADDWSKVVAYVVGAVDGSVSVTATGVKDTSPRRNARRRSWRMPRDAPTY